MAVLGISSANRSVDGVEQTRAITGLLAVIAADVAIALAAILGMVYATRGNGDVSQVAAILSSGFTAIGTTTTAYFGIKSMANAANNLSGSSAGIPPSTAAASTPPITRT